MNHTRTKSLRTKSLSVFAHARKSDIYIEIDRWIDKGLDGCYNDRVNFLQPNPNNINHSVEKNENKYEYDGDDGDDN